VASLPFAFNYLPTPECNFWKTYSLSVVKYPTPINVPSFPWMTVDEG
jgi:hypothetical protein